jgi:hypothetical protein
MQAKLRLGTNFTAVKSFLRQCSGLLLPLLLLVLPACQRPEEPTRPADLLPKERMIGLLAELHVLEARVEGSRLHPDSARALYLAEHKALLKKTQVTDSTFQRSYRYYGIHGKDLDEIYKAVIDTLKQQETRLDSAAARANRLRKPLPPH